MIESNQFRVTILSIWWGAFTFYAGIVVPLGMRVLGSHTQMGMITQQVSIYLNIFSLIIFLLYAYSFRYESSKTDGLLYQIVSLSLIASQLLLFLIHGYLTVTIDFEKVKIINPENFYLLHRIYLIIETAIWLTVSGLILQITLE
ncbi:hypothetical protein LV89_02325 [Arcicella aurantiaca]|uniref:DUF4149 domain-containing protein n=1 Tax=Arcicella aurantiaca TaxID=591202 RepID=A0A316ETI0_9BACT|nr:hypothetical protein [Arcicella aurantiaca]PWK26480.1 hypothetical protein LV89_02325 [Arcicella aurantiaca]